MRFRNLACPSSVAPHLETSSLEKKTCQKSTFYSLERLKIFSKDAIPFGLVLGTGGS